MITHSNISPILRFACRSAARIIQVFGVYVIVHGHYSPGGGFQGGALLAAAVFLLRIGEGREHSQRDMPSRVTLLLGSIGVLVYGAVGLLTIATGGRFLDYDAVPLPGLSLDDRHYWAILVIELAVGLAVMAILVGIFDRLLQRFHHD
ncbi:MnhB domain-containing protein [Haloferula sp. A504]|jgi:multicomponent Na+:H+ antiporter subunit B|uniref:MnhB domain-containing protein n=1 Tax=Haloferula sp. A504 TaxID=3373601 RepID=UPI0031C9548F|nr:MnhB domain-containing protein [Verrucomicrobiaceae bacterium E54]